MFVITKISNGIERVVFGPSEWKVLLFKRIIKDEIGIYVDIPVSNPARSVVTVAENSRIVPVSTIGHSGPYDRKIHVLKGPLYKFFEDRVEQYWEPMLKDLGIIKQEKLDKIANSRWLYENAGIVYAIGGEDLVFPTDRESRSFILQAFQLSNNESVYKWKSSRLDGSVAWVNLNKLALGEIVELIVNHVQLCFSWEEETSKLVRAATTTEEVAAIKSYSDNEAWEKRPIFELEREI